MCELCKLIDERNIITHKYYEDALFMMVDCKTCKTPMLISKKHQAKIEEADEDMAYHLFYKFSRRIRPQDWFVDYKMKTCKDHWHCYLKLKEDI